MPAVSDAHRHVAGPSARTVFCDTALSQAASAEWECSSCTLHLIAGQSNSGAGACNVGHTAVQNTSSCHENLHVKTACNLSGVNKSMLI